MKRKPTKEASEAASVLGRRSVETRIGKWGKRGFKQRLRDWGKLGGRPRKQERGQ